MTGTNIRSRTGLALCAALLLHLVSGLPAESVAYDPSNLWFQVGEELVYDIHWGVIYVGQTHVTTQWAEHEGRKAILIRYVTRTSRVVETFYPVDDLIETLIDAETFLPIYHIKRLSEGRYRCDEVTTFNFAQKMAHWKSKLNKREKDFPIEPDTRDIVTFMYYVRSKPFTKGDTLTYRIMADEKLYDLIIHVKDSDVMKFPKFGKVRSARLQPEASFQGIFVRKGKITLWVSDDDRRVCTRMMASVPVANIRLTLRDVRGPGDDRWVESKKSEVRKK